MRILVTAGIFPPEIGGPATYVPRIADGLARLGHEVMVVAPREPGSVCPIEAPLYRIVQFDLPRVARFVNYVIALRRAFTAIRSLSAGSDVIFVNGLEIPSALVARGAGIPMVVKVVSDGAWELANTRGWTPLDPYAFQHRSSATIEALKRLHRFAPRRARVVVTPSQAIADIVTRWGIPRSRIRVIHNSFIPPDTTARFEAKLELIQGAREGFCFMTVGRLLPLKGIADILTAIASIDGARLVVVGDGPERPALERRTKELQIAERVHFTGRLSQQSVYALLRSVAGAFVLNSSYETFPHVILEAAHFGVPIVATAVGGTIEIVTDDESALLVPPNSQERLAAALRRLIQDRALRDRLVAGAHRALARFSPARMIAETERTLKEASKA